MSFFSRLSSGAIPRGIATSGPAILSYGFRPFFLLAGLWAVAAMALWVAALTLGWPIGGSYGPVNWHAHEMLFGYTSAALAGFMLTAIPNWTGRLPVSGMPLLVLVVVWIAGRLALLFPDTIGVTSAMAVDAAFLPLLFISALREIVAGRNWQNLKIVMALLVLSGANIWYHAAIAMAGDVMMAGRLALGCWVILIMVIGGRIVPSFTRNWLARQRKTKLPAPFGILDKVTILATLLILVLWVLEPYHPATGIFAILAAALNAARLWRWRGVQTWPEPIVFVLHAAYAALCLGFMAIAATAFGLMTLPSAIHIFTIGGIGGMTLGVMSRAALGHTGRKIEASPLTVAAYIFVGLAAVIRPVVDFLPGFYYSIFALSGLLWLLAFSGFLVVYAPILFGPRQQRGARE